MSHIQNQRGIKRNATDLLATSNQPDTQNPRPPKRQRTSNETFQATLQTLLTMSDEDVNQLQEPLRQQALVLRAERNISSPADNRHKNPQNHRHNNGNIHSKPALMQHDTLMEVSSDDESDDDEDEDDFIAAPKTNNRHTTHFSVNAPQAPNPPMMHRNAYNTNYNNPQHNAPHYAVNTQYNRKRIPLKVSPAIHVNHVAPQQYSHTTDTNILPPQPTFVKEPVVHSSPPQINDVRVHPQRYINVQDLIGKNEGASSKCYCVYGLLWIAMCIVLGLPFFNAIPLSNRHGTNYCDTDARVIRAYGDYNCIPCPLNAKYCIKGEAWCEDTSYWVDPEINECVEREYMKQVLFGYKNVFKYVLVLLQNGGNSMLNYYHVEVSKWQSVKEWKAWYQTLRQLSFVEFCKLYQMEVMVSFAVFTWYLPMLRCLIIFLWTRMILPTLDGGDDQKIVIYLKLLSYFAPILFGYQIWNKIAQLLTAEK